MKPIIEFILEDPVGQNIFVICMNILIQLYLVVFNSQRMTMVELIQSHFLMIIMINVIAITKRDL